LNLREKIQSRLDELESLMQTQTHLENPELVTETLESVAKFWSTLDENDREFLSAARFAIAEQRQWH